jgi:hypothetical protein
MKCSSSGAQEGVGSEAEEEEGVAEEEEGEAEEEEEGVRAGLPGEAVEEGGSFAMAGDGCKRAGDSCKVFAVILCICVQPSVRPACVNVMPRLRDS